MMKNPATLRPNDSVMKAAQIFIGHNEVEGIPVIDDENNLTGLVTRKHVINAYANEVECDIPISKIMISDVITLNENYSTGKAWDCPVKTLPVLNNDGKVVGMLTRTNLIRSYYRDLQEVKRLNKELNAIIESSYDGIYITDGKGITLRINSAYERIMGIKAEEVIERKVEDLVDKGVYTQSVTSLVLEKKKPATIMYDIKTGGNVLITGNPAFNEKGEIVRVVTNVRDMTELNSLKKQLEETRELTERYELELKRLRGSTFGFDEIIAYSSEMRNVLEIASRVAKVDSTVMITGESGVGKDVVASAINTASPRGEKQLVKVNCAAIPETLLESELFGYEKGAFTGARIEGKRGMFEMAEGGTIFLDEIGELPLHLQPKLLRVIQDRELVRVGGNEPIKLDVRIIAATNKDLDQMIEDGEFREDLYYRLNVVPIHIPPLRERKEDIAHLIQHFLKKYNTKYNLEKKISLKAVDCLTNYSWPGNVRELENVIERLIVMVTEDTIQLEDLPTSIRTKSKEIKDISHYLEDNLPLKDAVEKVEKALIIKALKEFKTTRKAAEVLCVDQSTVVRKAQKYGINN